jgi:endonuclease/exonuclease/phosphatase family metal-dependent hydrolase
MRIASWNLNHRAGTTRFRPEAVDAAIALDADAVFFNEYFPQEHGPAFAERLANAGWCHQLISAEPGERANRTFVASRVPVEGDCVSPPTFDRQLPANLLTVRFREVGLRVLALRVPAYEKLDRPLILRSWDWLESTAALLVDEAAVIVGDLNVSAASSRSGGGDHFKRMRGAGWSLATPEGEPSFFSSRGHTSTVDHLLHTRTVRAASAYFVSEVGGYVLAGSPGAISDHAAIVADLRV